MYIDLVHLAEHAYNKKDYKFPYEEYLLYEVIEVGGERAIVYRSVDTVIVSFSGTDDASDWLDNLDISEDTLKSDLYGDLDVHSGFNDAIKEIIDKIIQTIYDYIGYSLMGKRVVITGHSKGGAMALLFATHLLLHTSLPIHKVVTFAAPRALKRNTVKFLNRHLPNDIVQYKIEYDPVPSVPGAFLGWRHVGKQIKMKGTPKWWFFSNVDMHSISEYREKSLMYSKHGQSQMIYTALMYGGK